MDVTDLDLNLITQTPNGLFIDTIPVTLYDETLFLLPEIEEETSDVDMACSAENNYILPPNYRRDVIVALIITISFGLLFTALQLFEYQMAPFTIADGIYGSTFYVTTGFHGFHVIVGTIFLIVCLGRHIFYHFLKEQHFGLEAAIWY